MFHRGITDELSGLFMTPLGFEVIIGALTLPQPYRAAKLQELLPGHPYLQGQNLISMLVLACIVISFIVLIIAPTMSFLFFLIVVLAWPSAVCWSCLSAPPTCLS